MKVSAKLEAKQPGDTSVSFEYFCPKTSQGVQNLYDRMDRMNRLNPSFIDITWNAGGAASAGVTEELVATAQNTIGLDTCMHLTCSGMSRQVIDAALKNAWDSGCRTILALRGDPPRVGPDQTPPPTDFHYAKDLIAYIREKYGDGFDIGVAAYPEGHPEESDVQKLIGFLKEKVDYGATFVITQMCYDADLFVNWVADCRAAGINVPIIPGIMPISGWASFWRRAKWCQVNVPAKFKEELEPYCNDDAAVREIGTSLIAEFCRKMIDNGITHLHFYTMNLEKSTAMILERLGLLKEIPRFRNEPLPWTSSELPERFAENVRPIFWSNRKQSYIDRTSDWDEFPNGRWGDSRSPAFGELERYGEVLYLNSENATKIWGSPKNADDLAKLIIGYIKGEVTSLPWSDEPVAPEIRAIRDELVNLNSHGYLTINSQPAVNGARSTHPWHGWGPANGYVYQKAYLELLIPPEKWEVLKPVLEKNDRVTYHAIKASSGELFTNAQEGDVNAVTWGIFPGKEVVQPTIVELASFLAWKDEAFRLADEWSKCYSKMSPTYDFLKSVAEDWYLVNIVYHDYLDRNGVFRIFP